MIDFTSFGKLIPDSVQLHYSLSRASVQLPYSLNSYRSLYPQEMSPNSRRKLMQVVPPPLPSVGDEGASSQFYDSRKGWHNSLSQWTTGSPSVVQLLKRYSSIGPVAFLKLSLTLFGFSIAAKTKMKCKIHL